MFRGTQDQPNLLRGVLRPRGRNAFRSLHHVTNDRLAGIVLKFRFSGPEQRGRERGQNRNRGEWANGPETEHNNSRNLVNQFYYAWAISTIASRGIPSHGDIYWPTMKILIGYLGIAVALFAQTPTPAEYIEAARKGADGTAMKQRVATMTAPTQVSVWGQDYLFLATSASPVTVSIDLQPQKPLAHVDGNHWMLLTKMRTGVLHQYQFYAAGKPLRGARRCSGIQSRLLSEARCAARQAQRETHPDQQNLRRDEI